MVKRIFLIILWVALVCSCTSQPAAPIVNGWKQRPAGGNSAYTVQRGDTLYSIAWAFSMDYRDLAVLNHLSPPYAIHSGQKLYMAAPSARHFAKVKATPVIAGQSSHPVMFSHAGAKSQAPVTSGRTATVVSGNLQWLWPAKGRVVEGFTRASGGNHGLDIAGKLNEPIVAAASGRVVYSGSGLRGYGNLIIIKHNDNFLSAYAYNKKLLVKEGAAVKAGQQIALMGSNNAGQVMLHFEIRVNGKPVNPLGMLR